MVKPFLRWAGGKRWLASKIAPIIRLRIDNHLYIEPFLGSGSMFFEINPIRALLSDLNQSLIITFKEVSRDPISLEQRLLSIKPSKREYYRIRKWSPINNQDIALRFIYLNRNCWGGLYRENRMGIFNVPYGGNERSHIGICSKGILHSVGKVLSNPMINLEHCDYKESIKQAKKGDIIYCDPTYRQVTRKHFDRYGSTIFSWDDQHQLAIMANMLFKKGVFILISNASYYGIKDLYPNAAVIEVCRRKGLGTNGNPSDRTEFLFVLDPKQQWHEWELVGRIIHTPANIV